MQVLIESGHDDTFQQEPVTIVGLSQNGFLEALDSKGQTIELHPDGNRWALLKKASLESIPRSWNSHLPHSSCLITPKIPDGAHVQI